jgi:alkylation response protein AidB-like acyl-CoA dehydrogenase
MFCHFSQAFQKEVFADRSYVLAPAAIAVTGLAQPVDGGFRLNGRWQWGTGAMHAQWVIVGARVEDPDKELDFRFFAMRPSEVVIDDTWYVDGMAGTGSNDIVIENLVVPEEQTASVMEISSGHGLGAKLYDGPLYRTPMLPILGLAAAMPALGQAKMAVRRFQESILERVLYAVGTKQADKPAAQMRLARAEIEIRQDELLLRQVVDEVMELRELAKPSDRARWLGAYAFVVDQSKRVLQSIAEASGAHAHFQSHPLQRAVRDINTLSCHVVFDLDARLEIMGKTMLGGEPEGLL